MSATDTVRTRGRAARGMAATILLAATLVAQDPGPGDEGWARHEFRHRSMGVEGRVVVWGRDPAAARSAADAAFAEVDRLDAIFSDWRDDSELNRLCERAGLGPVEVSADLYDVLLQASILSRATGGAFDVTVGPLTRLWRRARADGVPPRDDEVGSALALVGWSRVRFGGGGARSVELLMPGMRLDLGGIAKGLAARRAVAVLTARGHPRCLVELGGDLAVGAPPVGASRWVVEAGCGDGALPPARYALVHESLSTSGDTAQAFEHEGVRYSHVVDPRSGRALRHHRCAVVIGGSGGAVDALASVASLVEPRKLQSLVTRFGPGTLFASALSRPDSTGAPGRLVLPDEGLLGLARDQHVFHSMEDAWYLASATPSDLPTGPWIDMLDPELSRWRAVDGLGEPRDPDDYRVVDGVLHIPSAQPGGSLRTRADYRDVHLRLDFALEHMANGGLFLRGDRAGGDPAYSGCEIQLIDDHHWEAVTGNTLAAYQFTGSLYASVGPGVTDALLPDGEWNTLEVLFQGPHLAVALNGVPLLEVDTRKVPGDPAFTERAATGFLGLQRYGAPGVTGDTAVRVRHFFLREL